MPETERGQPLVHVPRKARTTTIVAKTMMYARRILPAFPVGPATTRKNDELASEFLRNLLGASSALALQHAPQRNQRPLRGLVVHLDDIDKRAGQKVLKTPA